MRQGLLILFLVVLFATAHIRCEAEEHYDWVTGHREQIPSWVFEKQGDGRYVGISDPMLDSINGENQALLRAWFLSVLDSGVEINILREDYERVYQVMTRDHGYYKYAQIVKFSSDGKVATFNRGQSFTTIFGEHIVEYFDVTDQDDICDESIAVGDESRIKGEYTIYGNEVNVVNGRQNMDLYICANINGEPHSTHYNLSGGIERNKLSRMLDDKSVDNRERGRFWYENSTVDDNLIKHRVTLEDGLWRALYQSLVISISTYPDYEYTTKNVRDNYDDGTTRSRNLALTRSIFSGQMKVLCNGWNIYNNSVRASWQVVNCLK